MDNRKPFIPASGYKHKSGAQKRKEKEINAEKAATEAKLSAKYFSSFLSTTSSGFDGGSSRSETSTQSTHLNTGATDSKSIDEYAEILAPSPETDQEPERDKIVDINTSSDGSTGIVTPNVDHESSSSSPGTLEICFEDPVLWPVPLTPSLRKVLVEHGPKQLILKSYPARSESSFNSTWFEFQQKNNTFKRDWLLYSLSQNSLFCFPCSLFGSGETTSTNFHNLPFQLSALNTTGFTNFRHQYRAIPAHESSQTHFACVAAWKEFQKNQIACTFIDESVRNAIDQEQSHWRKVLRAILDAILYLAKNNLAFRGSSENIHDSNCGNFLSLIKLLSNYYAPLGVHLDRLKKKHTSYLSPSTQNEFISLCGNKVRQELLRKINSNKYYSIMFDSTPDVAKHDQLSQVIRTVECDTNGCKINEYFIDFIECEQKTGLGLSEVIISKLNHDGILLENCRGQEYDNGSNMSGCYNGVQKHILDKSETACFVPSAAHSLNLVGVNAAEKVKDAKLTLGQIQNIFLYFHATPKKWNFLNRKQKTHLKGQSTTRWSSRAESVSGLYFQFWQVVETLIEITNSEEFNSEAVAGAEAILAIMLNFKCLLSLTIWERLLVKINICNLSLQNKTKDIEYCSLQLKTLLDHLNGFRNSGFKERTDEANTLAKQFGIDENSGFDVRSTRNVIPARFRDTTQTNSVSSMTQLEKYEKSFFNPLLDHLIREMETRFVQIREFADNFGFLWGKKLASLKNNELICHARDLASKYHLDLDEKNLINEIQYFKNQVQILSEEDASNLKPLDVLNLIYKNELQSCYPNISTALRIFLTLPVSVASNERSFSKLKQIKNYLRSSMGQERLTNLAILSIENEELDKISFDELIHHFVTDKCRRVRM